MRPDVIVEPYGGSRGTSTFLDGGTRHFVDKRGNHYWVDNRIGAVRKGWIYDRYPEEAGARVLSIRQLLVVSCEKNCRITYL